MTKSFLLFVSLLLLVSCSTIEIPDVNAYVTLPASGDGYSISTVSHVEHRIPKAQWDLQRRAGVVLLSDDWAKLKYTILKNCLANECKQSVGALDGLFSSIDTALKALPK